MMWRYIVYELALVAPVFLVAVAFSLLAHYQTTVAASFNNLLIMPWISLSFLIGALVGTVIFGHVCARRSIRITFILSLLGFTGFMAMAAGTKPMAIAGSVFAGLSASGILMGAFSIIIWNSVRDRGNPRLCHLTLAWGLGCPMGPLMAAFLDDKWRIALGVVVGLGMIFLFGVVYLVPVGVPLSLVTNSLLPFDFLGLLLMSASLVTFTLGTNWAGTIHSFGGWQIILLYWASGIAAVMFIWQQSKNYTIWLNARLLPENTMRTGQVCVLSVMAALSAVVAYLPLFYVPIHLRLVKEASMRSSALLFFVIVITQGIGAAAGGCSAMMGPFCRIWILAGSATCMATSVVLSKMDADTSMIIIVVCFVWLGIGSGGLLHAVLMATHAREEHPLEHLATFRTMHFAQLLGALLGLSVAGALFMNKTQKCMLQEPNIDAEKVAQLLHGLASIDVVMGFDVGFHDAAVKCFLEGLSHVYIVVYASAAGAMAVGLAGWMYLGRAALIGLDDD